MRKVLLYGGAFNPPHLGHERLLAAAITAIEPHKTIVIPSEVSPHKHNAVVPFFDRMHMARTFLDCGDVTVSGIEHTGRRRKSYTFHTVKRMQKKYPDATLCFLIGSDMLLTFTEWHLYRRLCRAVVLVAAVREQGKDKAMLQAKREIEAIGGTVILLPFVPLEINSTEIREKLHKGQKTDGLISAFVAQYAKKRELYL